MISIWKTPVRSCRRSGRNFHKVSWIYSYNNTSSKTRRNIHRRCRRKSCRHRWRCTLAIRDRNKNINHLITTNPLTANHFDFNIFNLSSKSLGCFIVIPQAQQHANKSAKTCYFPKWKMGRMPSRRLRFRDQAHRGDAKPMRPRAPDPTRPRAHRNEPTEPSRPVHPSRPTDVRIPADRLRILNFTQTTPCKRSTIRRPLHANKQLTTDRPESSEPTFVDRAHQPIAVSGSNRDPAVSAECKKSSLEEDAK